MASKTSIVSKREKKTTSQRHCLLFFPAEGTHGVWPECLIRKKGQFGFEAKFGRGWYECRVDLEGTKEECEKAQDLLEKNNPSDKKQWSSAETELSDNEESSISSSSSSDDENEKNINQNNHSKVNKKNKNKNKKKRATIDSTDDEEIEILKDISSSINKKHTDHSNIERKSKKFKCDDTVTTVQPSSSNTISSSNAISSSLSDIENLISKIIDDKMKEVKRILQKIYAMQKRASGGIKKGPPPSPSKELIENNINLLALRGNTASRYLLNVARVILTPEQFSNGFLPDFRGNKTGRVPIPEETVQKLQDAVKEKFGYKDSDMKSVWETIRTSLVQKVNDVRKSDRKSEKAQEQGRVSSTGQQNELVSAEPVDQTEVDNDVADSF